MAIERLSLLPWSNWNVVIPAMHATADWVAIISGQAMVSLKADLLGAPQGHNLVYLDRAILPLAVLADLPRPVPDGCIGHREQVSRVLKRSSQVLYLPLRHSAKLFAESGVNPMDEQLPFGLPAFDSQFYIHSRVFYTPRYPAGYSGQRVQRWESCHTTFSLTKDAIWNTHRARNGLFIRSPANPAEAGVLISSRGMSTRSSLQGHHPHVQEGKKPPWTHIHEALLRD